MCAWNRSASGRIRSRPSAAPRRVGSSSSQSLSRWRHGQTDAHRPVHRSSSKEVSFNWNAWIRQLHRWLSIIFTATVIANFVAMALGKPPDWVVYSPLLPLLLLLLTGLYLFVLPYAANRRSARTS